MNKTFTRPVFAVELYDPAEWDFGPVTFQNVVIVRFTSIFSPYTRFSTSSFYNDGYAVSLTSRQTATGQNTSWCNNDPEDYSNAVNYTVTGARATTNSTGVTCNIDSVVLHNPQDGTTASTTPTTIPRTAPKQNIAARMAPSICIIVGSLSVIALAVVELLCPRS